MAYSLTASRTSRTLWLLTAGCFYSFFVFGFVDNLKGPTLPNLLDDLGFRYGQGGTLLFGGYLGFLVATLATGPLADAAGKKIVILLSGLCMTVGVAVFGAVSAFWLLTGAMFVVGLGMGAIEVGANALIVDLHDQNRGRYLNLLGVFHGIGAMVVPLYAGYLLSNGVSWRQVHLYALLLTGLLFIYFLWVRFPAQSTDEASGFDFNQLRQSGFSENMIWFYALLATYVASELGTAAWLVEFLQQTKGFTVASSTRYLSFFFLFIMVGRLVGSALVDRIGYLRIMLIFAIGATICLSIGTFGSPALAIFIPLTGFFFSLIFPTVTAAVSSMHPENTGTILGLLFAFGGLGGALGPWLVGVGSDWLGIQLGFSIIIVYCVMVTALLSILLLQNRETN